ncbi:phosphatidylcholine/phosphatidylserine synthase [soil metagenome]
MDSGSKIFQRRASVRGRNLRLAAPNIVTIAALCTGLTSIVFASSGRADLAVFSVLAAALLDGCDGGIARLTGGETRFGGELDSLSEMVCFGAAPAFILYEWQLAGYGLTGWVSCLALAACCALRLARFSGTAETPPASPWRRGYFTGIPAPCGAFLALLPICAAKAGWIDSDSARTLALAGTPLIGLLMVSRWPTFSGETTGRSASKIRLLAPIFLGVAAGMSLGAWPWPTLVAAGLIYAATLPLSRWRYNRNLRIKGV